MKVRLIATTIVAAACLWAPAQGFAAAPQVAGLEVDAAAEPLGIDDATPRFTGGRAGRSVGWRRASYRVVVASTAARAAAGQGDVWDSGRGRVERSVRGLRRAGAGLADAVLLERPGRGRVGDAVSWFETAYLSASDWKGDWISGPQRIERRLTYAEGAADDACCVKAATTLSRRGAAGATNVKVNAVNAFTNGVDGHARRRDRDDLGGRHADDAHDLGRRRHGGRDVIRVADITWIRVGDTLTVDGEDVTVTSITPSNFGASHGRRGGAAGAGARQRLVGVRRRQRDHVLRAAGRGACRPAPR